MLDKIVKECRFLLKNFPGAEGCRSYLDARLSAEAQEEFQFGYFPGVQNMPVLTDLVGADLLRQAELYGTRMIEDSLFPRTIGWSSFENHPLIMPYRNPYGQVVALVGRTVLPETEYKEKKISKYKNTSESGLFVKGNNLFGLYENKQAIVDLGCVYIVEGQFDVIKAFEIGFRNIVALGNNNMTAYQFSVISRYSNNLFLLLDNDEAGQKGRKSIISKFGAYADIRNFYLPDEYKDVDEYITKGKISSYAEMSFLIKG